ncbi:hypothetical protein F2P56_006814, partial [Juglans regia]
MLQYSLPLITTFLLLLPLIWLLKRCRRSSKVQKLPSGPRKLPLIGNLHNLFGSLPHHALRELAGKYGPLMHLQLGEVSAVVATSPRIAREFLQTHDLALGKRQEVFAAKTLTYDGSDIVLSPFGDYWRQMRKVCVMELLSAKRVQSFSSLREVEKFLRVITGTRTKVEEIHRKLDKILENIIHEHKENQKSAAISE